MSFEAFEIAKYLLLSLHINLNWLILHAPINPIGGHHVVNL